MLLLAFDTSSPIASIALSEDREILAELTLSVERTHMEKLMPGLEQVLEMAKRSAEEIKGIIVGIGPGSFTGTRIGVVVAKTLAQALKIVVTGVPSLDVLAYQAKSEGRYIAAVADARRGEVYTSTYRWSKSKLEHITSYRAVDPQLLAEELAETREKVVLVGDGLKKYLGVFQEEIKSNLITTASELWYPMASSLISLAGKRTHKGKWEDLFQLVPMYIRLPDIGGK